MSLSEKILTSALKIRFYHTYTYTERDRPRAFGCNGLWLSVYLVQLYWITCAVSLFVSEGHDALIVSSEDDRYVVVAGTFEKLVEQLACEEKPDPRFVMTFLLGYRHFSTASELLTILLRRYPFFSIMFFIYTSSCHLAISGYQWVWLGCGFYIFWHPKLVLFLDPTLSSCVWWGLGTRLIQSQ